MAQGVGREFKSQHRKNKKIVITNLKEDEKRRRLK
jgi:hypothetical protein